MGEQRPELPRGEWRQFMDVMTRQYEGWDVSIEVLSEELGDLTQAERLPLAYLEYDDKDDVFSVAVGGQDDGNPVLLRHGIEHPQRILSDKLSLDVPRVFDVIDAEGVQTIITLHRPVTSR